MPMHRRFLLERQHKKMIDAAGDRDLKSGTSQQFYDSPLDEAERSLDVLSSSWWVRLREGQTQPETRRAHSAAIFEISRGGSVNKDVAPDAGADSVTPEKSTGDIAPTNSEPEPNDPNPNSSDKIDESGNPDDPDPESNEPIQTNGDTPDATEGDSGLNHDTASESPANSDTTAPASPDTSTSPPASSDPGQRNLSDTMQEYMMITGGFSDSSWSNFPVCIRYDSRHIRRRR